MALVMNSTTLRNVIDQKTTLTLGDGFIPVSSDKVPFLHNLRKLFRISTASKKETNAVNDLIANVNLHNESLEEVSEKIAFDWWAFGNAIVELKRTEDKVLMYHVPLENVGIKKADNNGLVTAIGICSNWDNDGFNESRIEEIPLYPKFDSKGRSAIHIKNYAPNFFYWGLPENVAARFWAEIEYRIAKYNITKFKNGFTPSALIQAYGSFTEEEAEQLSAAFKDTFTDTENGSRILLQVLRNKTDAADVHILEDKSEGNFLELQKLATQAIVTANRWTMSLAGIAQGGKLGTNQQIKDELEFVTNTTIKQGRRKIMQKIINPFILENRKLNTVLGNTMLTVANSNPISLASSIVPKDALNRNEMREALGYAAEEKEEPTEDKTVV